MPMPTDYSLLNSTQNSMVANSFDLAPFLSMLFLIIIIAALIYAASTLERYKTLTRFFGWILTSLYYAITGGVVSVIGFAGYLLIGIILRATGTADPKLIAIIIGGYILLSGVGYAATWVYHRLKENWNKTHEHTQPLDPAIEQTIKQSSP
jgi:hypothetical protein